MTCRTLVQDFLEYLETEKESSQLTIRDYNHYLKNFLEFAGDISPKQITPELIKNYRHHLAEADFKRVTQNFFLIALRQFLKYLTSQNIETFPYRAIVLREEEKRVIQSLDLEKLLKLLKAPDVTTVSGVRDRSILEVLFSTGFKVSKVVKLNRGDLLDISLSESADRWVKIYINSRKDNFAPLFIRFQGKVNLENQGEAMRLTVRSIERIVEKYAKQIGEATPTILRHAFAMDLIEKGASTKEVAEKLEYKHQSSTKIYLNEVS